MRASRIPLHVPASRGNLRRIQAVLFLLLALAFATSAESARLAKDEGWLAVVIDNGIGATSVRIDGPGLSDGIANALVPGRNLRLLKMRAGTYRWSTVNRPNWVKREYFTLDRSPVFEFRVEAGVLNYSGDLVMQSAGGRSALFYRVSRSLDAAFLIDAQQPGLRDSLAWRQEVGPDPFMAFAADALDEGASAELAESATADEKALRKTRVDPAFKRAFQEIFSEPQVDWMEINPAGDRVFFRQRRGELQILTVRDLASGKQIDLLATYGRFTAVSWGGDRLLHIAHGMARGTLIDVRKDETLPVLQGRGYRIAQLPERELDAAGVRYAPLPDNTWLVESLRDSPRAVVGHRDAAGETHFFEIDETQAAFTANQFGLDRRLDKEIAQDDWSTLVFDRAGALRAAMVYDDNGRGAISVRGAEGRWKRMAPPPFNTVLQPFAFTPGNDALVAFSDHERDRLELVRVSLDDGSIGETLLRASDADLGDAIVRPSDGLVIGAQRYRDGRLRPLYRDQTGDARVQRAERQFPGKRAVVLDESSKARRAVVLVHSSTDRGTYYVFDEASGRFDRVADAYAKPEASTPAPTASLSIAAAGGRRLDGRVSLPVGAGAPFGVVVIPAGGALAAEAADDYDATVQLLTHSGYAVLRARYDGDGSAPWGASAVADLEKLLDAAIGKYPLDRARVAVLGAGQGGHASLMALVRAPQRFHCGIALAPVTDLPLMFTSDAWSRKPQRVRAMQARVGDPSSGLAALQENSPVYRYRELARPLLLIHGTADTSVSFEHSLRLRTLLASAGHPPQWLPLRGGDQTFSRDADLLAIEVTSRQFLQQCFSAAAGSGSR